MYNIVTLSHVKQSVLSMHAKIKSHLGLKLRVLYVSVKQVAGKLYTVAIGIGKQINPAVLHEMAGENGTAVISFKSFEELASKMRAVRKKVCGTLPTVLSCCSDVIFVAYCRFISFI